ncbi:MAG: exodeoxyribonuclease [Bacteroidota bacterium]|jgi:exodeoxyribonuclease-3
MKIISFNINGIRASVKKGLLDSIYQMNPDVLGFQETKATPEQVREALADLKGYEIYAYSAERAGYSGTTVITKTKPVSVSYGIGVAEHDTEGRAITVEMNDFYIVNTYVPNSGEAMVRLDYREQWDKAMLTYLKGLEKKKPVILMGDLNVAHQPIDLARPKENYNKTSGYTQREIDGITNYVNAGLVDTFRLINPDTIKYSWWSLRFGARAKNVGWRIDYVLASAVLSSRVKEAFILNEIEGSDHCPVGITID